MAGSGLRSLTSRLDQRRRTVLILLAVVVAILAAGGGGSAGSDSWTGIPGGRALSLVAQVGIVIGALLVLVTLVTLRHPRRLTARRQGNLQLVAMVVVFVALTRLLVGRQGELSAIDDVPAPPPAAVEPGIPVAGRAVTTTDLMVLVAIVASGLAILWWAGRAAGDDGAAELGSAERPDDGLTGAIGRASEHLFVATDPRSAVMVAYRGLEQALEGMDLPRASTETPGEHLARSLEVLSLGGPATAGPLLELADLYQVARFSERPVTADDQRRAAEALGSAHLHLSGAGREGLGQEAVAAEGDGSGTGRAEVGR